jgi:hypothetical protein
MLPLLLPEGDGQHLLNLAAGWTSEYTGGQSVRSELRRLRSLGLLRMRRDRQVGQMQDGSGFDLADYVELTELGKRWVRKLQEIENGEGLGGVTRLGPEEPRSMVRPLDTSHGSVASGGGSAEQLIASLQGRPQPMGVEAQVSRR